MEQVFGQVMGCTQGIALSCTCLSGVKQGLRHGCDMWIEGAQCLQFRNITDRGGGVCVQCSLKEFYGKLDINDFEWETSGRCPAEPDQVVGCDPADLSRRERGTSPTVIVSTFNLTHTSYWRDDAEPLIRQLICPGAAVESSGLLFHNEFLKGLVSPRNGHVVFPCVGRRNEE